MQPGVYFAEAGFVFLLCFRNFFSDNRHYKILNISTVMKLLLLKNHITNINKDIAYMVIKLKTKSFNYFVVAAGVVCDNLVIAGISVPPPVTFAPAVATPVSILILYIRTSSFVTKAL